MGRDGRGGEGRQGEGEAGRCTLTAWGSSRHQPMFAARFVNELFVVALGAATYLYLPPPPTPPPPPPPPEETSGEESQDGLVTW